MKRTKVIAHRGFSAIAPENTMVAFQFAIETGADGIELDIHMTKDGELVVLHDETVDRTTDGTGWVKYLTLDELKQLDAGSWFSEKFSGEQIPTLSEVLHLIKDTSLMINIELKNSIVKYPQMEKKVVQEVERYGLQDQVILSSFNHFSLRRLRKCRPYWKLGALYDFGLYKPWIYARWLLGVSAIHPVHFVATDSIIKKCHQHEIAVRPYTVDEPQEMKRLLAAEVDAIITNVPDQLLQIIR